ncbi:MAG: patatin-like phospholipase family protein [Elusimicrobia bacterium]|nr:patatin-like phospholipase family protein [Elusimicrobiota bacterium]
MAAPAPSVEDAPLGSRPTALVLSGGAALGAWQGGVLWELDRRGLRFPQVLGSSAGSINGAAYLQGTMDLLKDLWRDVPRKDFLDFKPRLSPPSLLCLDSVARYLRTVISEERCRAGKRCWFTAVSVDVNGGGTVHAEYSPEPEGPWDGPLLEHILGSIAVPFVFPPRRVSRNGGRPRILVDGHVTCFVDLARLLDRGARDILFVDVFGPEDARPRFDPRGFISTIINQLMRAQVENSVAAVSGRARAEGVRVFEFYPSRHLDESVFLFKKHECRRLFDLGVRDAAGLVSGAGRFRIL